MSTGSKIRVFRALTFASLSIVFVRPSYADSDRHPVHPTHQGQNYQVNEYTDGNTNIYTNAGTEVSIPIPSGYDVIDWNDPIHRPTKAQHLPTKGTVRINGNFFIYEPYKHAEGYDVFTWWPDKSGEDNNYSVEVKILPQQDNPKLYLNSITDGNRIDPAARTNFPFREGSATSHSKLIVLDPDSYEYNAPDSDLNVTFEPDDEGNIQTEIQMILPLYPQIQVMIFGLTFLSPYRSNFSPQVPARRQDGFCLSKYLHLGRRIGL